jgi:GTP cyclohydrolase II
MDQIHMRKGRAHTSPTLFGSREHVGFGRGLAEFRAGRPLLIADRTHSIVALPVEGLNADRLAAFIQFAAPAEPRLVVTARRARALGIDADTPVALEIARDISAKTVLALVADAEAHHVGDVRSAGRAANAAIEIVKFAQILPAVLIADLSCDRSSAAFDPSIVTVEANAVMQFRAGATHTLTIAGEAQVPLDSGMRTRFVVFRDAFGADPVAVVVGTPDLSGPVPVRIHSACLTGDVFGSRRCDCGDQLRLALARLQELGGGVILYLPQEGRGVGLANKMRTYKLQEGGLDTVDANTTLGFDDDERDYGVAVRMLQMLGCTRVILLTNNPAKLDGLAKAGIEIADRMPLETPINADNRRYMTAKAVRGGHKLGHVIAALAQNVDANVKAPELAP